MKKSLFTLAILILTAPALFALTGKQIIEKSEALPEPTSAKSRIVMTITKGGRSIVKEFKLASKKINGEARALVTFIRPSKMKVLTHSHKNRDDDQWIRLSSGRVKRIAGADQSKSFVNSHLTYYDLQTREINDYSYKKLADASAMGVPCYVVEAKKVRGSKIYDKIIIYVRKSDFFVVKLSIYKKGHLYKHIENYNIQKIEGILTPKKVMVKMARTSGTTVLNVKTVQYNTAIRNSVFNKSSLK